jgi:general secretion pathway protein G
MSYQFYRVALIRKSAGFSLVELVVVVAMLSLLAALLLPAMATAQGKAREVTCNSNLRQVGMAVSLYLQDNDGAYPYAVDAVDVHVIPFWASYPDFQKDIPSLPQVQDVLLPYTNSRFAYRCPADTGFISPDFQMALMDAFPSSFQKFGSSYGYRTEIAAKKITESQIRKPAEINLFLDLAGQWHGTLYPLAQRYNVLFADGHVKNLDRAQVGGLWVNPL